MNITKRRLLNNLFHFGVRRLDAAFLIIVGDIQFVDFGRPPLTPWLNGFHVIKKAASSRRTPNHLSLMA
jgi:hypothetical protein